jgi:hypothetical protein
VVGALVVGRKIDNCGQDGSDDDPKKLVPIEERHADPGWVDLVVERRPKNRDELNQEEQVPPAPPAICCAFAMLLVHIVTQEQVAISDIVAARAVGTRAGIRPKA